MCRISEALPIDGKLPVAPFQTRAFDGTHRQSMAFNGIQWHGIVSVLNSTLIKKGATVLAVSAQGTDSTLSVNPEAQTPNP